MGKLSKPHKDLFAKVIFELATTYRLFHENPKAFCLQFPSSPMIDPPCDLNKQMLQKRNMKQPCFIKLPHSRESKVYIKQLGQKYLKQHRINCFPEELEGIFEDVLFEYINEDIDGFIDLLEEREESFEIDEQIFLEILNLRIKNFKEQFLARTFRFPVTVFNLDSNKLSLSPNIILCKVDHSEISSDALELHGISRAFEFNYFLKVKVKSECSYKLLLSLAQKARDATVNILILLATKLSSNAIPISLSCNQRAFHFHDFYFCGKELYETFSFADFQFESKNFWKRFLDARNYDDNLIDCPLEIPELLLIPHFFNLRIVDLLESALIWFGDAALEDVEYIQIQKLISSLETIVNFEEKDVTRTFIKRIGNLHMTKSGVHEDVKEKAHSIYKVRSKIVHGGSIQVDLNFNPVEFCSTTLLNAIRYFSYLGFDRQNFNKELPKFLDDMPNKLIWK